VIDAGTEFPVPASLQTEVVTVLKKEFRQGQKFKDVLINIPEIIAGIALITAVGATGINVFTRYVLRFTFFWYADITVLAFFWLSFMSCAAAYRRKMHYGIDIIHSRFGEKGQAIFTVFYRLLILIILSLVFYCVCLLVAKLRGKWLPTMHWSYIYCYIPMFAAFLHMVIYTIKFLIDDVFALVKKNRVVNVKEEN